VFSVQCSVFSVQCSVFSVQCSVFSVQCSVFSVQWSVVSVQCSVFSGQWSVVSVRVSGIGVQLSVLPPPGRGLSKWKNESCRYRCRCRNRDRPFESLPAVSAAATDAETRLRSTSHGAGDAGIVVVSPPRRIRDKDGWHGQASSLRGLAVVVRGSAADTANPA